MKWRRGPRSGDMYSFAGTGAGMLFVTPATNGDPVYCGGWFADGPYPVGRIGPYPTEEAAQKAVLSQSRRALRHALRSLTK